MAINLRKSGVPMAEQVRGRDLIHSLGSKHYVTLKWSWCELVKFFNPGCILDPNDTYSMALDVSDVASVLTDDTECLPRLSRAEVQILAKAFRQRRR